MDSWAATTASTWVLFLFLVFCCVWECVWKPSSRPFKPWNKINILKENLTAARPSVSWLKRPSNKFTLKLVFFFFKCSGWDINGLYSVMQVCFICVCVCCIGDISEFIVWSPIFHEPARQDNPDTSLQQNSRECSGVHELLLQTLCSESQPKSSGFIF